MKQFLTRKILFSALSIALLFGGAIFLALHTKAQFEPNIPSGENKHLLIYASDSIGSLRLSDDAPQVTGDFGISNLPNEKKEVYLSPDRKLVAITAELVDREYGSYTRIVNIDGTQVTLPYYGEFISWTPDSGKVLLYVSPMEAPWRRKIYALDVRGKYYDAGLPEGTISADISPADGSILYSLTSSGSDNSTLYIRDSQGNERMLLKGDKNIFAWVRWSPKGDKVAFMKADLFADSGELLTMNSDGAEQVTASDIAWNYPAVWSPDGTRLAFSNAGNIWEYDANQKILTNITNFNNGDAQHPSYSADGSAITFSSNAQIWTASNGAITQLTNDMNKKDYPVLP